MSQIENKGAISFWYASIAGLCAILVGVGISRFAFTPLIPLLVNQHWVTVSGAGYLGALNFAGYLLGAWLGQRIAKYFEITLMIKISLVVSFIGLALCSIPLGFSWLGIWRCVVGFTGGFLTVLAPSIVLQNTPELYRGRATGIVFTGVGLGIVMSGLVVSVLAKISITATWLSFAVIALAAIVVSWSAFSHKSSKTNRSSTTNVKASLDFSPMPKKAVLFLILGYTFYGFGIVPHSLFWVDYVHEQLNIDAAASSIFWAVFGVGALIGPFSLGFVADKLGLYKALIISYIICWLSLIIVLFNHITTLFLLSSFLMGAITAAIATLSSSRVAELVGINRHPEFWGKMTLYAALSLASGAYGMSWLLQKGFSYTGCFIIAQLVTLLGLAAVIFARTPSQIKIANSAEVTQ